MGVVLGHAGWTMLCATVLGQSPPSATELVPSKSERLLALHVGDAAGYSFYHDATKSRTPELRREPIYRWTNPTRVGGQAGDVFIWTDRGRPEVIASIFSHPHHHGKS